MVSSLSYLSTRGRMVASRAAFDCGEEGEFLSFVESGGVKFSRDFRLAVVRGERSDRPCCLFLSCHHPEIVPELTCERDSHRRPMSFAKARRVRDDRGMTSSLRVTAGPDLHDATARRQALADDDIPVRNHEALAAELYEVFGKRIPWSFEVGP